MNVIGIGMCAHDCLVEVARYPKADEKVEVVSWDEQGGGPVATALATLSKLGVSCSFHGIAGDDTEGNRIRQAFRAAGVDASGLRTRPSSRSHFSFIVVEKGTGRRTIFWRRPSGRELTRRELGHAFLRGADFLLLDGLMKDVSLYAAKKARAAGVPVMLDAGRVREGMVEIARHCDYLVGSETFAREMGLDKVGFRKKILSLGVKAATFTLGGRGSFTLTKDDCFETPAFKVKVVDTTGAGDVFHGAYVYGLLQKWELRKVVEFASAVAAIKCTKVGGRKGIPTYRQVSAFMRSRHGAPGQR